MIKESVMVVDGCDSVATYGTVGLRSQLAGKATTISNMSAATGGIGGGRLIGRAVK